MPMALANLGAQAQVTLYLPGFEEDPSQAEGIVADPIGTADGRTTYLVHATGEEPAFVGTGAPSS